MAPAARDAWATFLFCLISGGLIFADTLRYPAVQGQGFGQGPAFYPQLLAGVLFFLGGLTLVQGLRSRGDPRGDEDGPAKEQVSYGPVIFLTILCVVFIGLMEFTGFFVGGFLLTFLSVCLIRRSWRVRYLLEALGYSLGMVFLIYLVFEIFVGIQLPEGSLFG
jgi:hypothetical protein